MDFEVLGPLQGRYDQAVVCYKRTLAALDELGEAGVLERLGAVRTLQGRGEARTFLQRSLGCAGARRSLGRGAETEQPGRAELRRGALGPSHELPGDAGRLWRELRLPWEQARMLERLGAVHQDAGNREAAKTARREVRRLFVELGASGTEGA